jgi:hypothetical protein
VNTPLQPGEPFNPYRMFVGLFIPEGLARSRSVSAGAKLIWGRLARYAGEDGRCYPTMKSLGLEVGIGGRQAQKYVVELEKAKLIRRVSRFTARAQTSNAFEFLWHELFETALNYRSPEGANDDSPRGANDRSYKESQIEESQFEEQRDPDYLSLNRKKRDTPPGVCSPSVCQQYPKVRNCLARYMCLPGDEIEYPSDRMVVEILDAAGTYDELEVISTLDYLYDKRGLKPFTQHGPRSFAWFKTVLQDHFTKKGQREEAANPSGHYEWESRNEARWLKRHSGTMNTAIESAQTN